MYVHDYRLASALSQDRLRRAEARRQTRAIGYPSLRTRLGLLLIATGERLAHGQATAPEGELSPVEFTDWAKAA